MRAARRSTTQFRAASMSVSELVRAPTKTMRAPGAMLCTASTSRVSSPYQSCSSPWAGSATRPGAQTCVN